MSKVEKLLLFILLFLLPSQLSWHIWPTVELVKSDYHAITIYVSDLLVLGLFLFMLFSKKLNLRSTFSSILNPWVMSLLLLILNNIFFSLSPLLSFYKYLQFTIFSLTMFSVLRIPAAQKIFYMAFPLSLIWVTAIGLFQSVMSRSIGGWFWWLGERPLSIVAQGVSVVDLGWLGTRLLRPYSVFPHPNALAGYLLVGTLLLLYRKKHTKSSDPRLWGFISQLSILLSVAVILLSFSVNSLVVGSIIMVLEGLTFSSKKIHKKIILVIMFLVLFLGTFVHYVFRRTSFNIRLELLQNAVNSICTFPLTGTGLGAYLLGVSNQLTPHGGFFQPVHNGPILLLVELGIPLFLVVGSLFIKHSHYGFSSRHYLLWLCPALLSLFDHYWITSHANLYLLVIVFCLSYISQKTDEPNTSTLTR